MTPESFFGSNNVFIGQGSSVAPQISGSSDVFIVLKWTGALNAVFAQESGGGYASSPNTAEDVIAAITLKGKAITDSTTSADRSFQISAATSNPQTDISFRSGTTFSRWNYTVNLYTTYTGATSPKASEL